MIDKLTSPMSSYTFLMPTDCQRGPRGMDVFVAETDTATSAARMTLSRVIDTRQAASQPSPNTPSTGSHFLPKKKEKV
jgi:hypothetical protein